MGLIPPHDSVFQYEDALLSSCASSTLVANHVLPRRQRESEQLPKSEPDGTTTTTNNHLRNSGATTGCTNRQANKNCFLLYQQYVAHYQRPLLSTAELQFWKSWIDDNIDTIDKNNGTTASTENFVDTALILDSISPRIEAFLHNVLFVHQHNAKGEHQVALNRFSDRLSHELPLMPATTGTSSAIQPQPISTTTSTSSSSSSLSGGSGGEDLWEELASSIVLNYTTASNKLQRDSKRSLQIISLHDKNSIRMVEPRMHGLLSSNRDNDSSIDTLPKQKREKLSIFRNIRRELHTWWQSIILGHVVENEAIDDSNERKYVTLHANDMLSSTFKPFSLDKKNKLDGLEENNKNNDDDRYDTDDDNEEEDAWGRYLNWSTEDNPDGVPIVHSAIDQGLCGSCWAISATGTLEASIARNMAYTTYEEVLKKVGGGGKGHRRSDQRTIAIQAAQQIERQAISTADLSIQEIIDCDNRYDQGCAGGNPLFAYYFLHRYGVTSTANYPYTGTMNKCRYRRRDQPIATVETWGILTADHENNMKKVLRYVGPVAVGLIGADPAFLAYKSGIFDSGRGGKCEKGQADHAMLITGYGEEVSKDGNVVKYWIARNSWGKGWGEDGYVRMARIGGKRGHPGICGIARSPSVALGGMFKKGVKLNRDGEYENPGTIWRDGKFLSESTMIRTVSRIQSVLHQMKLHQFYTHSDMMMVALNEMEGRHNCFIAKPFLFILGALSLCLIMLTKKCKKCRLRRCHSVDSEIILTTDKSNCRKKCQKDGSIQETTHLLEDGHAAAKYYT